MLAAHPIILAENLLTVNRILKLTIDLCQKEHSKNVDIFNGFGIYGFILILVKT